MSLVVCEDVAVAFGAVTVFGGLSLRIEPRDRVAVVGANGSGKSSLLAVLAGTARPASGSVDTQRRLRVAYLPQDAPEPVAPTVLEEAMASRDDIVVLHEEMAAIERRLRAGEDAPELMERWGEAQHAYQDLGGYDLEARARAALGGLGLGDDLQARDPRTLSGGQVRRLELAKLLLQDADLMLVDEPTNHLDLSAIEWLEDYMREVPAALVVVSHDRRFLDRVCTRVVELAHGAVEEYPGTYTQYTRLRTERRERRRREWVAQQEFIAHQEEFIRRYKAGQRAKEARGRQTRLDRLERVPRPVADERPRLRFTTAPAANVLLRATDLVAGRDATPLVALGRTVLAPGDRVAVVGANGSGKSTLLHTLARELEPVAGSVTPGARLRSRLYRQDLAAIDERHTVLEELLAEHPVGEERGRTVLGSVLFEGDDVFKPVAALSGGERARLALARLALEPTNLLLLDEPTNHLDIPAQEVLEEAIRRYPGGVVLVSHDRALVDAVATRVWAIEDGRVREVLGGYADLQRARERERTAQVEPVPALAAPGRRARQTAGGRADAAAGAGAATGSHAASRRRTSGAAPARGGGRDAAAATRRERAGERAHAAELRRVEARIADAEEEMRRLAALLSDPQALGDGTAVAEAGREYERLRVEIAELYEVWASQAG